jgi:hypothetical protein
MRIKQRRFDSEKKRLFRFENLLELLHTKNVIELSVLHFLAGKFVSTALVKSLGETACAILP